MTIIRNDKRREEIWQYFKDYHEMAGRCPTMQECGDVIGIRREAVRHYILGFQRENKMRLINRRVYFTNPDGSIIEAKKQNAKKKRSTAGKAGAEALKRIAIEKGVERFTAGMGADEDRIKANIERIVNRAAENGTLYHPRPNYVVLVGQKAG